MSAPGEAEGEPRLDDPAPLSRRLTPARDDVAADYLRGKVEAARFVPGAGHQVTADVVAVRRTPGDAGMQETQALFGEVFTVYDQKDGWAWGQAAFDGYVGYVRAEALSDRVDVPTHRVTALRTYRYPDPDLKSVPLGLLSMNAKLTEAARSEGGKFACDSRGGWVFAGHTAPMPDRAADPVAVMESYRGAPYLWGGRQSLGLDCSALIQLGYEAAGRALPRDADMQEAHLAGADHGEVLFGPGTGGTWNDVDLRRGDLIYWPGHTGVMVDAERMLHANATAMATTIDVLSEVVAHLEQDEDIAVRTIVRPR